MLHLLVCRMARDNRLSAALSNLRYSVDSLRQIELQLHQRQARSLGEGIREEELNDAVKLR